MAEGRELIDVGAKVFGLRGRRERAIGIVVARARCGRWRHLDAHQRSVRRPSLCTPSNQVVRDTRAAGEPSGAGRTVGVRAVCVVTCAGGSARSGSGTGGAAGADGTGGATAMAEDRARAAACRRPTNMETRCLVASTSMGVSVSVVAAAAGATAVAPVVARPSSADMFRLANSRASSG